MLLRPSRVFDGEGDVPHEGWVVLVRGERIERAGPAAEVKVPAGARAIDLPGTTLLPGLIDAHTHVLLHPYDEASWDDQVLKEPLALRVCRATNHLREHSCPGSPRSATWGPRGRAMPTSGSKQAVEQGIVPGPRMLVVTRAIVATGSYAPTGFAPEVDVPQGAEEADGVTAAAGRPRPDRPGRRLDQGLRRRRHGRQAAQPSFSRRGARADRRDGPLGRACRWRPTRRRGGDAPGRAGRRRDDRARRRRRRRGLPADGRARTSPSARRWPPPRRWQVPRLATRDRPRARRASRPARAASSRPWRRASRSSTAATSASSHTARAPGELELLVESGLTPAEALRAATSVAARVLHLDDRLGTVVAGRWPTWSPSTGDPTRQIPPSAGSAW